MDLDKIWKSFLSSLLKPGSFYQSNGKDESKASPPNEEIQQRAADPFYDIREYMAPWKESTSSMIEKFHNQLDHFMNQFGSGSWINRGEQHTDQTEEHDLTLRRKDVPDEIDVFVKEYDEFRKGFGTVPRRDSPSHFPGFWRGILGSDFMPRPPADLRVDHQIDSTHARSALDDMFKNRGEELDERPCRHFGPQWPSTSTSTYTTSTLVTPGGIVEKRSHSVDRNGDEVRTVTRSIGDQKHTVTEKNVGGHLETKEDMVNMDKGDLDEFNKKFQENVNIPVN